jgi:hypothetical protein
VRVGVGGGSALVTGEEGGGERGEGYAALTIDRYSRDGGVEQRYSTCPHLVVEVVVQPYQAVLVLGVMPVHVLEQLDLVQRLVQVVLVVLRRLR